MPRRFFNCPINVIFSPYSTYLFDTIQNQKQKLKNNLKFTRNLGGVPILTKRLLTITNILQLYCKYSAIMYS